MPWASARSSWMASCTSAFSSSSMAIGVGRIVLHGVAGQADLHRQRDEVLLGAVVQVALELAALGVAGGHDAGPGLLQLGVRALQLVERRLQRGVELDVVQGEADLAGQLGEHAVVALGEGLAVRPGGRTTMRPEQLAGVGDRGDAHGGRAAGRRRARAARCRATSRRTRRRGPRRRSSFAPISSGAGSRCGHAGGQLEVAARRRSRSRPIASAMRLAQRLGQLQQQLVERDGTGQALAEGAQRLVGRDPLAVDQPVGPLGQPAAGREVQQRGDARGHHRQQQQRPLAAPPAAGRGRRPPRRTRRRSSAVSPASETV